MYRFFRVFSIIVLSTMFFRCAYLNTFYNAKIAFNSAHRAHMKFLRTRADTTEETPSKIISNYDRAIAKSLKTMEVYPKVKKWHDDAIFLMGKAAYFKGDLDDAIRRFRRLQREFPESPFIPESFFYLGKAYMENDNLVKAEETFQLILEKYPQLNDKEEITLLLAHLAILREGKAQAIELLEKTLKSITAIDKKMEIYIQIARLYIDLKQYDRAISVLLKAPRKKDFPKFLYMIDYNLLVCYISKEDYGKALLLADQMARNNMYMKYVAEILLKRGIALKLSGKIDEAIEVFDRITDEKLGSGAIQGEAYFEKALIYQHVKGDFQKAKECYQLALSLSTDDEIKRISQERGNAIGQLEPLKETIERAKSDTDTSDTALSVDLARYKLGETYWLFLAEPDSALRYFSAVTSDTICDGEMLAKSFYAQAWILRHFKNDTAKSDSIYGLIIDNHPKSIYAQKSQKDMGIEVTILTRLDSAQLAFIDAERLYFEEDDPVAACNSYLKVFKRYSDLTDIASKSLFAAAWLCDHAMNKKKVSALKFYKMLCDNFPESDLCLKEAKPRIKFAQDSLKVFEMAQKNEEKSEAESGAEDTLSESTVKDSMEERVDAVPAVLPDTAAVLQDTVMESRPADSALVAPVKDSSSTP